MQRFLEIQVIINRILLLLLYEKTATKDSMISSKMRHANITDISLGIHCNFVFLPNGFYFRKAFKLQETIQPTQKYYFIFSLKGRGFLWYNEERNVLYGYQMR